MITLKENNYTDMEVNFDEVFHQFYSPLCNYALKIVKDESTSEDIIQTLFIQLWENDKLNSVQNLERFLLRAAKFKCLDYLKTKYVKNEINYEVLPDIIAIDKEQIEETDVEPLLHYFAAKLPPKTREVFLLSRTSGLTYAEIADELDISIKTVENQMGRALRIMRVLLKEKEFLALLLFLNCN